MELNGSAHRKMAIKRADDFDNTQSFHLDVRMIKILEELQEGKQFTNKKIFPKGTLYMKVSLDYFYFRSNLSRFCLHLDKIKVLIRTGFHAMYIFCVMEENLLNLVYNDDVLEICLPRFILREELKIFNNSFYTYHDNCLRIFQEDVSQLFKKIEFKTSALCFTLEELSMANSEALPQSLRLAELLQCDNKMEGSVLQRQDFVVTMEIKLTKTQITFLIGSKGTRIESLREESGASIKIIPISEKMTIHEKHHPDTVQQTILISGDLYSIALAITSIESALITLGL